MATIDISDSRVNALISFLDTLNAKGIRKVETVAFPGGSYVLDTLNFVDKYSNPFQAMTNLGVIAPGVLINDLSTHNIINPPISFPTNAVIPGVNDFNITVTPSAPPQPIVTNFVGAEMIPNSGRHYALPSPLDHFVNGNVINQAGKFYVKVIQASPFGNMIEWDEITVVGS